ncbi:uncharacterized protein AMSG_06610 [Thecamonas trahens ATCC 50062]|uniref:Peptidase A1 domain-containing protein n=1 Tax=Thecamonas trahens ATCC 50062 TaxID=461836 RepID=A0A0L0DF05_THETB|nr:hypothetical protein AMSG_06610 [Thecamonas trahens ATCC 50062]KNC50721.1 hypothetical protein AMSG_06610 [Thecamonas trahens ATCC 50062]|eukprot:XP_013756690.1 hypothetical protein AMSG_06610 [Thecamonas trahens ATCC 50062]
MRAEGIAAAASKMMYELKDDGYGSDGANVAVPLGGSVLATGTYFATTVIGDKPYRVIFDTGSSDTLVHGYTSSSGRPVPCSVDPSCICDPNSNKCLFDDGYGDGTEWAGYVMEDDVELAPGLASKAQIGSIVISVDPHSLPDGIAGIQGMAYSGLSSFGAPSPFSTMAQAGLVDHVFSHCLPYGTDAEAPSVTYGPGNYSIDDFEFTPIINEKWYVGNVTGLGVGGVEVDVDPAVFTRNISIYDSGTTLWLLQDDAFWAVWGSFLSLCDTLDLEGVCGDASGPLFVYGDVIVLTPEQFAQFPDITIKVARSASPSPPPVAPAPPPPPPSTASPPPPPTGVPAPPPPSVNVTQDAGAVSSEGDGDDVVIVVPPSAYLLPVSTTSDGIGYFYGIQSAPITIMGDVVLSNYHVRYEMDTGRVGFGPLSTCPTVGPVPPLPPTPSSPPSKTSTYVVVGVVVGIVAIVGAVVGVYLVVRSRSLRHGIYDEIN